MQFTCRATAAAIHFPTGFPGFIVNAAYVLQVLNAYGKVYPTPPPSRRPIRVKQARLAAEQAAHEAHQRTVNEQGTALEETDKAGRHKLGLPPTAPQKLSCQTFGCAWHVSCWGCCHSHNV